MAREASVNDADDVTGLYEAERALCPEEAWAGVLWRAAESELKVKTRVYRGLNTLALGPGVVHFDDGSMNNRSLRARQPSPFLRPQ